MGPKNPDFGPFWPFSAIFEHFWGLKMAVLVHLTTPGNIIPSKEAAKHSILCNWLRRETLEYKTAC